MPAPTSDVLKANMKAALISRFSKRDDDGNVVAGEIPQAMEDLVAGISEGVAQTWSQWQATQLVNGGVTTGGSVVGAQLTP